MFCKRVLDLGLPTLLLSSSSSPSFSSYTCPSSPLPLKKFPSRYVLHHHPQSSKSLAGFGFKV